MKTKNLLIIYLKFNLTRSVFCLLYLRARHIFQNNLQMAVARVYFIISPDMPSEFQTPKINFLLKMSTLVSNGHLKLN